MSIAPFSADAARAKRAQLITDGFAVIPGVMPPQLLNDMRRWTDRIFETTPVPHHMRYQGSGIFALPTRSWPGGAEAAHNSVHDEVVGRVNDNPAQRRAAELLGLEDLRPVLPMGPVMPVKGAGPQAGRDAALIILSKPPHGPPLYWHQDYAAWNSPRGATPWPEQVFFSYYLTDTTRENGCLRVIPGSHRRRHPLHDLLPNAHEPEIQSLQNLESPVFRNADDAVDVPMKAGDLIVGDARLLHSAWANKTGRRRTLTLSWYRCFRFPHPPSWWAGPVPDAVRGGDAAAPFGYTRVPNLPWRPRGAQYAARWGPAYPSIRAEAAGVPPGGTGGRVSPPNEAGGGRVAGGSRL